MPDKHDNDKNQRNPKINWKQKGFGWVPDYPDIRDFYPVPSTDPDKSQLQKEVQKESISNTIDDLANALIRALDSLNQRIPNSNNLEQDDVLKVIEELKDKAYGNVRFNPVKVYRVLRRDIINQDINGKNQGSINEQRQKSREQQEEVVQIRRCLYSLIKKSVLSKPNCSYELIKRSILSESDFNYEEELSYCRKLFDRFSEPEFEIQWLTEPKFDVNLTILVCAFQHKFNLRVDGIVGINTLLTLERCLVYKVLSEDEHDFIKNGLSIDQAKLKEIRQQEIRKLKKYLSDFSFISKENLPLNGGSWDDWKESPEFDETAKFLVKQFQKERKLFSDGVVRYDTLIKLNECIANLKKSDSNSSCQDNSRNTEPDNPARLVTVSSLIPNEIFEALVDKFFDSFNLGDQYDQLSLDKNTLDELVLSLISAELVSFLVSPVQKVNDFEESETGSKEESETIKSCLKEEIKKINFTRDSLINIVKNQFIITDSIIAVILILISPLTENSNLKKAALEGIEKFKQLLDPTFFGEAYRDNKISLQNSDQKNEATSFHLKQLAWSSLQRSLITLNFERDEEIVRLRELGDEKDGKEDQISKQKGSILENLIFYALFERVFFQWGSSIFAWNKLGDSQKKYPDIKKRMKEGLLAFSKKEHFRLVINQKTYQEEKHFLLAEVLPTDPNHPPETKPLDQNPVQQGESSSCEVVSQSFSALDSPEIILPISSQTFIKKNSSDDLKEMYFLLPGAVDLSYWCSPIEDQGSLNACTACAGVGLLEYFAKRTFGEFEDLSTLFLYKAARDLRQRFGDVGAPLRDTMRSMILFGVPPEQYWPYQPENVDEEPPALCYSYAQNYQTLKYFRLDRADISTRDLLLKVKAVLAAGFPCMFGFTAYTSIYEEENVKNGFIPFPNRKRDRVAGGHAVMAVGYNDFKPLPYPDGTERSGALLIRNSWGREWGLGGYGWLPYDYVLNGLTGDWWSLLKAEWFGQGYFGLEARNPGDPPPENKPGNSTTN